MTLNGSHGLSMTWPQAPFQVLSHLLLLTSRLTHLPSLTKSHWSSSQLGHHVFQEIFLEPQLKVTFPNETEQIFASVK